MPDPGTTKSEATAPIGRVSLLALLRAFGRNTRVIEFLDLYGKLKDVYDAEEIPEDANFVYTFRIGLQELAKQVTTPEARNRIEAHSAELIALLRRLDSGSAITSTQWRVLINDYSDIIQALGADKEVYLRPRAMPGTGPVRWLRLQKATPKEAELEALRGTDPELYERTRKSEEQRLIVREAIKARIVADGMKPDTRLIMGRPMNIGVDAAGQVTVYDEDGFVGLVPDFMDKVRKMNEALEELRRVNPIGGSWQTRLDPFRKYKPEVVDASESPVSFVAMSDDPNKQISLTRIYPTKIVNGEQVVSAGRFKGFWVPELVNAAGRQVEGSVHYYDPDTMRIKKREMKNPDGSVSINKTLEPYITLDRGKLLLRISGEVKFAPVRQAMAKLPLPDLERIKDSRLQLWRFEAKDFGAVRDVLGSVALSYTAAKFLQAYFDDLTRAEQAAESGDLSKYDETALGLQVPIRHHVKKAVAWLDANGSQGICALDTGMGKTVTAIATIQNLRRKGERGRFLFVCEKDLLGNLPKEIYKFLPLAQADELMQLVDLTTYLRFGQSRDIDPTYGDNYVAIFFDEAHMRLKKKTSKAHKAATSVKSKHKVLMTASPQVRSPLEVFTMAAVAKGIDLNTPAGRRIEAGFIARFCETVGGRVVGVKQSDPSIAREFRTFIKRNLFYEDKRSGVGEAKLGNLSQEVEAVTMPEDIEVAYREVMSELLKGLKEVAAQRFEGDVALAVESAKVSLRGPLAKLTRLSDTPDRVVPGATNPKLDRATQLVDRHITGRTLLFTESKDLAADTFERMKKTYPGKSHALGLVGSIILFNGATGEHVKFTSRVYSDPDTGRKVPKEEWKTHVLSKIIQRDPTISTLTLTGSYAVGQNLQSFGNVIHLDRDDWSNEVMKQRTARAWRAGNLDPVNEYTLDLVYSEPDGGVQGDMTLDEIRKTIQSIDARLFQEVVLDSQSERLGLEWLEMKKQKSSLHQLDRKMVERAMSPYAKQLGQQESS